MPPLRDSGPRVSLRDEYDGRRVVNTPMSLHACQLEGVDPYSLTIAGRARPANAGGGGDDASAAPPTPRSRVRVSPQRLGSTARGAADVLFDAAVPQTREQRELKERFIERRRAQLLASVMRTYKRVTAPRSTLPPPPLALTGELPEDKPATGSARARFMRQPKSVTSTLRTLAATDAGDEGSGGGGGGGGGDTLRGRRAGAAGSGSIGASPSPGVPANATVLSSENAAEIARHYERLQHEVERTWEANVQLEKRARIARDLLQRQQQQRAESLSARGRQRDEHLERAQHQHAEQLSARQQRAEQRLRADEERAARVVARRQAQQEEARVRGLTSGDAQRSASEKIEAARISRLAERTQEQEQLAQQAAMRREQERATHAFEGELHALMARDTALRAARAAEYRKEVFSERVAVADQRSLRRRDDINDRFHDAMVQRDAVHRVKQSLDTFFHVLPPRPADATQRYSTNGEPAGDIKVVPVPGGTALPRIEPPQWLQRELGRLHETRRQRSTDSARARSVVIAGGVDGAATVGSDGATPDKRQVKRATHPRRWPFTAPESAATKVAYPKWMYED